MEVRSAGSLRETPSIPQRFAARVPKGTVPLIFRMIAYAFSAGIGYLIAYRCGGRMRIRLLTASITGGATLLIEQAITKKIKSNAKKPKEIRQTTVRSAGVPRVGPELQRARRLCREIETMAPQRCTQDWLEEIEQQMGQLEEYDLPTALQRRLENCQERLEILIEQVEAEPPEEISEATRMQRCQDERLEGRLKRNGFQVLDTKAENLGTDTLLAAMETVLYTRDCLEYAKYSEADGETLKGELLAALRAPSADAASCAPLIAAVEDGEPESCREALLSFISSRVLDPALPIEIFEADQAFRTRPTNIPAPSRYPPPPKAEFQEVTEYTLGFIPRKSVKRKQPEDKMKEIPPLQLLYRKGNQRYKGLFIDQLAISLGRFDV